MAKIAIGEVDNYSTGKTNFFKLENDRDTATVRFMYNTLDDVSLDVVHEVEIDGKRRLVNCLRTYDEPVDNCPLCRAGMRQQIKLFVPVYNEKAGEVQYWQRGKSFINDLSGLCDRYNPLVSTKIDIQRNGKKGEQTTRYQLFPVGTDDVTIDDLPEVPDTNGIVLNKSFDELASYAENGYFSDSERPAPRASELPRRTAPAGGRTRPNF